MDLTIAGVDVALGRRAVLHAVTATLRAGRVTAVLGANGAGKSTLLKAAAALVPVAAGQVRLGDRAVAAMPPAERARLIGYLPQEGTVHWNLRARDLVALGRLPHRARVAGPSAADEAAIDRALTVTDTAAFADRPVADLSGGEKARVLLARVLAGTPAWLLADEPLASLDPAHQIDLLARLRAEAAGGMGVMLVLHDLVQAQRAADDAILLRDGRIVAWGPAADILTREALESTFGIRVAPMDDDGRRLWVPVGRR